MYFITSNRLIKHTHTQTTGQKAVIAAISANPYPLDYFLWEYNFLLMPAFPEKQLGHKSRTSICTKYVVLTKSGNHKMWNSNMQLKMCINFH